MFGKKKRMIEEQRAKISELERKLGLLEEENRSFKDREIDLNRREVSIGRVILEATEAADKTVAEAQDKADVLLKEAQDDREAAKRDADRLVEDAYRNARDIVKEAEQTGQQKLDETQERIEQYATLLNSYDKLVQEQIRMAEDNAKRFSDLSRALHETVPKLLASDGTPLLDEEKTEAVFEPAEPEPELTAEPVSKEPETPTEAQADAAEEKLWTVDEIAKDVPEANAQVDTIIDEILSASGEAEQ